MPIYFSLQEALLAASQAPADFDTKISGGPKAKAEFVQKKDYELKPPPKPQPIPKPKPELDPKLDLDAKERERLNNLINDLKEKAKKEINYTPLDIDNKIYEEPPPLTLTVSLVEVDPSREKRQLIEGAEQAQQVITSQNLGAKMIKPLAKAAFEAIQAGEKISKQIVKQGKVGIANIIRHPVATAQMMYGREVMEKRKIDFSGEVSRKMKAKLFPDSPEIPMVLGSEFVKKAMEHGRARRNESKKSKNINDLKDANPLVALGAFFDTQERRALEWLDEELAKEPKDWDQDIKNIRARTVKNLTDIARKYSITVMDGDKPLANQAQFDSQILLKNENRQIIDPNDPNNPKFKDFQDKVKTLIKDYVFDPNKLTEEEKIKVISQFNKICVEIGLTTEEKLKNNEYANDILALIEKINKDDDTREYYKRNWPKLNILSNTGYSFGDTRGGAIKFTRNQEISLKHQKKKDAKTFAAAGAYSAGAAAADTIGYLWPYAASWVISGAKVIPRSIVGKGVALVPIIGPVWAGFFGGTVDAVDIKIGKKILRESTVTSQLRQVSRDTAILKPGQPEDYVRADFEDSLVKAVPASEITEAINNLILADKTQFSSETNQRLDKEGVRQLIAQIAHAKARISLTMKSGGEELNFKTQNWVSYHEGQEHEELTNLMAASTQSYARLLHLQSQKPDLFTDLPFYDPSTKNLKETIEMVTTVIEYGLKNGTPASLIDGSLPINGPKSIDFYKQILTASGMPEDKYDQMINFFETLQKSEKIKGRTILEWLDEKKSLNLKSSELKRLKKRRFAIAGGTAALTSAVLSGIKEGVEAGFDAVHHDVALVQTTTPEAPTPSPQPTITEIPWTDIFSKTQDNIRNIFMKDDQGDVSPTQIQFAHGINLKYDNPNSSIDLVDASGKVLFNDFLVGNQKDGYTFNPNFKYDDHSQPIDLSKILTTSFIHNQTKTESTTTNFWDLAKNEFRMIWGNTGHGNKQPDHDLVFETTGPGHEEHPYGLEIRFLEDTVKNPQDNQITSFGDHFNDKTLAALIEIKGLNGAKDGHILLIDCFERVEDGKGGYYYSLKLDPTSSELVTLDDGTQIPMSQIAQNILNEQFLKEHPDVTDTDMKVSTMDVLRLANNNRRGLIDIGFVTDGDPENFDKISGQDKVFISLHLVTGAEDKNETAIVAGPEIKGENVQGVITPTDKFNIQEIPQSPPPKVEVGQSIEAPQPLNLPLVPGAYHTPQLSSAGPGAKPTTPSSTPLTESVINFSNFKREVPPSPPSSPEMKKFIEDIVDQNLEGITAGGKIKAFIYKNYFTETQQDFLKNKGATFIFNTLNSAIGHQDNILLEKLRSGKPSPLNHTDKNNLKHIVIETAKKENLTEKEGLLIYEFLLQRSIYDNFYLGAKELKIIKDQLAQAKSKLTNLPPAPTPPQPKPKTNPSIENLGELTKDQRKEILDKLAHFYKNRDSVTEENFETIMNLVQKYALSNLDLQERKCFQKEGFSSTFYRINDELNLDHTELLKAINSPIPLNEESINELDLVLEEFSLSKNEKNAVRNFFIEVNNLVVLIDKNSTDSSESSSTMPEDLDDIETGSELYQIYIENRKKTEQLENNLRKLNEPEERKLVEAELDVQKEFDKLLTNGIKFVENHIIPQLIGFELSDIENNPKLLNLYEIVRDNIIYCSTYLLEDENNSISDIGSVKILKFIDDYNSLKAELKKVGIDSEVEQFMSFMNLHLQKLYNINLQEIADSLQSQRPVIDLFEKLANLDPRKIETEGAQELGLAKKYLAKILGTNIDDVISNAVVIGSFKNLVNGLINSIRPHTDDIYREIENNLEEFNKMMEASNKTTFKPAIVRIESLLEALSTVEIDLKTGKIIFPEEGDNPEPMKKPKIEKEKISKVLEEIKTAKKEKRWTDLTALYDQLTNENELLASLFSKTWRDMTNENNDPKHTLHDTFYPLKNSLIKYLTEPEDKQQNETDLRLKLIDFNEAINEIYPDAIKITDVKELLNLHEKALETTEEIVE